MEYHRLNTIFMSSHSFLGNLGVYLIHPLALCTGLPNAAAGDVQHRELAQAADLARQGRQPVVREVEFALCGRSCWMRALDNRGAIRKPRWKQWPNIKSERRTARQTDILSLQPCAISVHTA